MGLADSLKALVFGGQSYRNKKGETFYLHEREGRGGQKMRYFSKNPAGAIQVPEGLTIVENEKTGLPVLKKMG